MEGTAIGYGGMRSEQCILFLHVGWLVCHQPVLFPLLVLLIKLLIPTLIYLLVNVIFKSISMRRGARKRKPINKK